MLEPPKRPFWKRKPWIAAAILWLILMYPLSVLPVQYLWGRGVITNYGPLGQAWSVVYLPLQLAIFNHRGPRAGLGWYFEAAQYFTELGNRHSAPE